MVAIQDGYVIQAEVKPGGFRKNYIYLEKTKAKAIESIMAEAENMDAFMVGQKFTLSVYENGKCIFYSNIMPYITYNLPHEYKVNFESENVNDEYANAEMFINQQVVEWTDTDYDNDLLAECKMIDIYKKKNNIDYTIEEMEELFKKNIELDKSWLDSIPNIKIKAKKAFPLVIPGYHSGDESDDDIDYQEEEFEYEEGLNDLG